MDQYNTVRQRWNLGFCIQC